MFYYGHLDRHLDFHLSTRSHRRLQTERQRRHDQGFPTAARLQDLQTTRRAQIGPTPRQRRSSVSTELGEDVEEDEIVRLQREWAGRGVNVEYEELRQQRWAWAHVALQQRPRPYFPPRTSSRRDLTEEELQGLEIGRREAAAAREREQQVMARLRQIGLV